ncbi:MAG TPA: hypothetical protein VN960_09025 [Gaiellaceae bacterium]|nr:hypothetical protein [Gaiellaceae bacterium]
MPETLAPDIENEQRAAGASVGAAPRRPRPQIETLADLIFGLSLSIGSLALLVSPPVSEDEINRHVVAFGFTFLILITAWLIYTTYMSVLPIETKSVTLINVVLLLLVAVIPYLLNTVEVVNPTLTPEEAARVSDYSSTLFTLNLSGIMLILGAFAHVLSIEEKGLVAPEIVRLFRNGRNRLAILAALNTIAIAPAFWEVTVAGIQARILWWSLPLLSYWIGRAVRPESRTYRLKP